MRRDRGVKNTSVISGLRLEADAATRLCDRAREQAVDKGKGDVAQLARYYIRIGLGYSHQEANALEVTELKPKQVRGLVLETAVEAHLRRRQYTLGLGCAGTARHLIRLGLGYSKEESLRREERFASLAAAIQEVRERG